MRNKLPYSLLTLLLFIFVSSSTAFAFESFWSDYKTPLIQPMKTCLEKKEHTISVTLPAEFLWSNRTIQLALRFTSKTPPAEEQRNTKMGFHGYAPYVKINNSFFHGYYHLQIPPTPATQEYLLEVNSSEFVPGKNTITLGFANYEGSKRKCPDTCCPCIFEKIEFRQAKPPLVTITVTSSPPGASIFIDDIHKGTSPASFRVRAKDHRLRLEKKGYVKHNKMIHVSSWNTSFKQTMTANGHMIAVKTNIKNVKLYIDGKFIGNTPLSTRLKSKTYQFVFKKDGYTTKNKTIQISSNNQKISADLAPTNHPITRVPNQENRTISATPSKKSVRPPTKFGRYYGLIVGNTNYEHLNDIKTATSNAKNFSTLLETHYGFSNMILIDASRRDFFSAIQHYRETLTENDNLLIYFAGHSKLDPLEQEGYWLPIDAEKSNKSNWIANSSIMATLRALQARHILIIASSWFSETLTREIKPIFLTNPDYRERVMKKKSRSAITPGEVKSASGEDPSSDNSIFARILINNLQDNKGIINAAQLFSKIRKPLILNSMQSPEFSDIKKAGHDGGEFFFIRQ